MIVDGWAGIKYSGIMIISGFCILLLVVPFVSYWYAKKGKGYVLPLPQFAEYANKGALSIISIGSLILFIILTAKALLEISQKVFG